MRWLLTMGLPALVIVGALGVAYAVRPPDSGVRVSTRLDGERVEGHVRVTKPGRRETLAGGRVPATEQLVLRLQPGGYVVRPSVPRGRRARSVRVLVRDGRFEPVTIRYRERR